MRRTPPTSTAVLLLDSDSQIGFAKARQGSLGRPSPPAQRKLSFLSTK
jgi:hypothetical protein